MSASSSLGQNGTITIEVTGANGAATPVHIRQPRRARSVQVRLHGQAAEAVVLDGWRRVTRAWRAGDRITLQYAFRTRAERDEAGRTALVHGPWLLGVAEATDPFFFDEPHTQDRLRIPQDANGDVVLPPAQPGGDPVFAVPVARFEVQYLPGRYPVEPGVAVLRPVSEQTGLRTCDWEYWFRTA